jgi:hypothetical protein
LLQKKEKKEETITKQEYEIITNNPEDIEQKESVELEENLELEEGNDRHSKQ